MLRPFPRLARSDDGEGQWGSQWRAVDNIPRRRKLDSTRRRRSQTRSPSVCYQSSFLAGSFICWAFHPFFWRFHLLAAAKTTLFLHLSFLRFYSMRCKGKNSFLQFRICEFLSCESKLTTQKHLWILTDLEFLNPNNSKTLTSILPAHAHCCAIFLWVVKYRCFTHRSEENKMWRKELVDGQMQHCAQRDLLLQLSSFPPWYQLVIIQVQSAPELSSFSQNHHPISRGG